jgi:hypothetical protein
MIVRKYAKSTSHKDNINQKSGFKFFITTPYYRCNPVFGLLHCVVSGNDPNVSDVHAASIFKVEVLILKMEAAYTSKTLAKS